MSDTSRTRLFGNLDELTATSRPVVDRPAGSRHPRVPQAVYPVDYGSLEGTVAADGDGVDVFRTGGRGDDLGSHMLAARVARDLVRIGFLRRRSRLIRRSPPAPRWEGDRRRRGADAVLPCQWAADAVAGCIPRSGKKE